VGVEYKKLGDLFQCIRDGRFADQLRGMKASAEFNWLLIEGRLRGISRGSRLQAQRRSGRWRAVDAGMTYQEMVGWVLTMCAVAGVMVWRTETREESVEWIRGLYNWWTAKEWEKHRAHMEFYTPPPSGGNPFVPPPLVQKVATVLPRIGSTKAARVAREFKSVIDLVNATEVDLQKVKGIGPKDAKTIREAVRRK
jgi:ERCC4-type nuclease